MQFDETCCIKFDQLHKLTDMFQVNIVVYELVELEDWTGETTVVARLVRRSLGKHESIGCTRFVQEAGGMSMGTRVEDVLECMGVKVLERPD